MHGEINNLVHLKRKGEENKQNKQMNPHLYFHLIIIKQSFYQLMNVLMSML